MKTITAASYLGTPPGTAYDAPDDGDDVIAGDVQALAALVLANDGQQQTDISGKVAKAGDTMTGALVLGAGATVSSGQTLALADTATVQNSPAKSYARGVRGIYAVTVSATQWLVSTLGQYEQGTDVTTGSPIIWVLDVPPESTITGASIWVTPPSGHGGVLPSTKPSFAIYVVNPTAGTYGLVASSATTDPTAIGSYESAHQFSSGVLAGAVGAGEFAVIEVRGEYGGSATPGLKAFAPAVTWTRAKIEA